MKTYREVIGDKYGFSLGEYHGHDQQDYFLQEFVPVQGKAYLQGVLSKKELPKVQVFMVITEDLKAISLPNCPFGGFWLSENISSEVLSLFIDALHQGLLRYGVKSVSITQAPRPYCHQADLIAYLLYSKGYRLENVLTHQFFEGKKKLKKISDFQLSKYNKKSKELGFTVDIGNVQNFNFLKEIKIWNASRGYKPTIAEDRLINQVSTFPERYFVISIYLGGEAVAHALAVKLTGDSLYYYQSAINPKDQQKITGELIMVNLLKLAAELKVSFLDLGSSDIEGVPNYNLLFFKSKYANGFHNKLTWQIQLR